MMEEEIFKKWIPNFKLLTDYGFEKTNEYYIYEKELKTKGFKLIIKYQNGFSSKIIDEDFGSEVLNFYNEKIQSSFLNTLREEYKDILMDIKDKCGKENYFISQQANRLMIIIKDLFNEEPDFPFKKYDGCGVIREKNSQKWYGLIMNVPRKVLDKNDDETPIDILNIKVSDEKRNDLIKINGFYPGYHMNHKNWITIILDDTFSDNFIMERLSESRKIIINKYGNKKTNNK